MHRFGAFFFLVHLIHLLLITPLTIHQFFPLRRIGGLNRLVTFVTSSFKQFPWIPLVHSLLVSLVWMFPWYRKRVFSIELQFLWNDSKWFPGYFTLYCPVQYIIWYTRYIIWKLQSWYDLLYLWEWWFIGRVVESSSKDFFFRKWKVFIGNCFIVSKGR